jgi:hypothetical protein
LNSPTRFQPRSGLRRRPSPPGEGDQDPKRPDLGSAALSFSFFFLFFSPFLFILVPRPVGSELPPPPLTPTTAVSTSPSPDPVLYGGNLVEFLGGSSLHQIPSPLPARPCRSSGSRGLLRRWLFGGHPVWGFLPVRVYLAHSTSEVDSSKPLLEGPLSHPNRTAIQGNFDSTYLWYVNWVQVSKLAAVSDNNCCGCSYHLLDWRQILCRMILMLLWLLLVVCCCFLLLSLFSSCCLWLCTAALAVGFLTVTYVTFAILFVGLCIPRSRVV